MVRNFTPIFLLFFWPLLFLAGEEKQTSSAKNNTKQKIEEVSTLILKADELAGTAPKDAEDFAEQAYDLSTSIGYSEGLFKSAYQLANLAFQNNKMGKAGKWAKIAVDEARKSENVQGEIIGLELLIPIYKQRRFRNKKVEAELELRYNKLNNSLALEASTKKMASLQLAYTESKAANKHVNKTLNVVESTLKQTEAEKIISENERMRLAKEKKEIEYNMLELKNESIQRALKISQKEREILQYEVELKEEKELRTWLGIGLLVTLTAIGFLIQYFRFKRAKQREQEKNQRKLVMQEKMASLGQLTAGIAHEIKNPLNFVNNFAEGSQELTQELSEVLDGLKRKIPEDQFELGQEIIEDLKQNSEDIQFNGNRIDRIVKSMMAHARGQKGEIQTTNLNQLVGDTLNLAYHGYRGLHPTFNAALEEKYDSNLSAIEVIPQDLSRALLNLFGNAFYALDQKQKKEIPNYISTLRVSTKQLDEAVKINIWDNGPGIPEHIKENVFQPFFSTKPDGEGNAGLGLSITNDIIVQGHHGTIKLETKAGEFTEFEILLPK